MALNGFNCGIFDQIVLIRTMSKTYIRCSNNHYFNANYTACPHCQNLSENSDPRASNTTTNTETMDGSTVIMEDGRPVTPRKSGQMEGATFIFNGPTSDGSDSGHTVVVGRPQPGVPSQEAAVHRKLMGWLVSFSISKFGVDFRLYEGQNLLGRGANCSIRITEDPSVSSEHATMLCRQGRFYLQDKMSTNPSFINDSELPPGVTQEIFDGDKLTVGKTILWVRFAPNGE